MTTAEKMLLQSLTDLTEKYEKLANESCRRFELLEKHLNEESEQRRKLHSALLAAKLIEKGE